jgi:hypothetical protein
MVETLPALPIDLAALGARAADFARTSRSAATERAYRSDWANFEAWCRAAGLLALPATPTTVGVYLTDCVGHLKVATLNRRIAAITAAPSAISALSQATGSLRCATSTLAASTRLFNLASSPRALMLFVKHLCWF